MAPIIVATSEGTQGGPVTIDGDVTVSGSGNRLRGARITGNLSVPGSSAGISYSSVAGAVTVEGSNGVLLSNEFCGTVTVAGSGLQLQRPQRPHRARSIAA